MYDVRWNVSQMNVIYDKIKDISLAHISNERKRRRELQNEEKERKRVR